VAALLVADEEEVLPTDRDYPKRILREIVVCVL
jgi:hypothetical protein